MEISRIWRQLRAGGACALSLMAVIYRFGPFELDLATAELRADGLVRHIEPQVFAVLALLVENRDRLVSRDELIEKVWGGRVVSDAAVASRVKSARQALDDDGQSQHFIRTLHRQGFRFVAEAKVSRGGAVDLGDSESEGEKGLAAATQHFERLHRPSLAVLPFRPLGTDSRGAVLATALPDELIAELSRLRWLFVTARGSSFRIRTTDTDVTDVGRLLRVRYCLCGTVEIGDRRLTVTVELIDTQDGGIVWADRIAGRIDDVHAMREDINAKVLSALEVQIPLHEAALARHTVPEDLDAWSAYHLGLQHLYRFNRCDNSAASKLFEHAVALDAGFARAHAGLSFAHFQSAFMHYADDVPGAIGSARRFAERGVELDPLDPFVNFTMGRSYWLAGDLETSLSWLERATTVSPHYAQGIYARAWTEALSSRAPEARRHVDLAMRLSPIDQLFYAMLATRAFTHMDQGEDVHAAEWAERAARSPGAHPLISMIAAAAHVMNGDATRAATWAANVRDRHSALTVEDFFRAFPMRSEPMRARVMRALTDLGF